MTELNQKWKIGDCQDLMQDLEPNSIDLIVTDPPYGYSFMGKDWDKAVPSTEIWKECLRILKPGVFAFIMSAPRQDVLAHNLVNLSDAGFKTGFTSIYWTFASGMPKAGNISKLVDKRLGAERDVIETTPDRWAGKGNTYQRSKQEENTNEISINSLPAPPQAKALDGSYAGFQPKPAVEIIMVVMKPLSEKTYVDQALANGKGITWLDDGRIPYHDDNDIKNATPFSPNNINVSIFGGSGKRGNSIPKSQGRFPANLLVSDDILNDGKTWHGDKNDTQAMSIFGNGMDEQNQVKRDCDSGSFSRYFDIDAWMDEQIKRLPKEVRKTFPFLITPKASKSEKGVNCTHPTVKPVKLISWLITIGSQKGDLVLDPFLGSGTALEAGRFTGRRVLGFEISNEWEHLYPTRCMAHQPPLSNYV